MSEAEEARWARRRVRYFRAHDRACAVCSVAVGIDLHHLRYTTFGDEPDEDLVPLCRDHHDEVHTFAKKAKVSVDIASQTVLHRHGLDFPYRGRDTSPGSPVV